MDQVVNSKLDVTKRTKLRRFPVRGRFDRENIYAILDAAPIAHIAFQGETPAVLPIAFWRTGDDVYFHGSAKNRMFDVLANGSQCCFAATLVDGFVAARAALHHSVNYRSVIMYGQAVDVTDPADKLNGLKSLIERFYPGRWDHIRPPSPEEFDAVRVFRLPIVEASAKIRSGFPTPYPEDFGMSVWAGVIPVTMEIGAPQLDPNSSPDTPPADFSRLKAILQAKSS